MECDEHDLVRVKNLLKHTSEFIAYFELAEAKMRQWQEEVNQQATRLELISKTGISELSVSLAQSTEQIQLIEAQCNHLAAQSQHQQEQLQRQCSQAVEKMHNESCAHMERLAMHTISNSKNLPRTFQFRQGLFALVTALLTAFIVSFYLSDELPWELHHQAMSERQAGKALLSAWPKLSQKEKETILNKNEQRQHG
jgi:hypothetical protein